MDEQDPHDLPIHMPDAEKLDLAIALARRSDRSHLGLLRLREQYPDAPERILSAGAYHLYSELVGSFVDVLAQVELNLRAAEHSIDDAVVWNSAYHLYNWLQVESLLPWSRQDVHDELLVVQTCLADKDFEGAEGLLRDILDRFEGGASPPMPD